MSSIHPSPSDIKNTPMKGFIEFEVFRMENLDGRGMLP
jgi:hypothetical protein